MERSNGLGSKAQVYTDLTQLTQLKRDAKNDGPEALAQVAKQFEQMFMSMMLKSMREANASLAEDSPFNSGDVKFYQDMLDQQMTLELSTGKGMGLAEVLVKQLGQQLNMPDTERDKADLRPLDESERMLKRALGGGSELAALLQRQGAREAEASELPPHVSSPGPVEGPSAVAASEAAPGGAADAGAEPVAFDSPADFVATLLPLAQRMAPQIGVDPKVLVAQAALETGWGRHITQDSSGRNSRNLFNIKADSSWQGERVGVSTLEYRGGVAVREAAAFRAYGSFEQSFEDYVGFLQQNPRYRQALEQAADPRAYLQELQAAGYATDPAYAQKINRIFDSELLLQARADSAQE
ncbi:flagellar assembly peptidoglycan hydrolase FlgJ [Marinobacterium rhizophilum]|uniref:Peptidoglycan hydrolase FlgJ n=1 Tax=Marinobacterium rhizophilum TaxID=420402 RepID=A0ABY5HFE7_9GAMM|nr:flagellar assembly peptidoglycan hydrolase FlgJ [Marinobacterium rhizophilum]UTW10054.1 flagellar assembly peptidoglycan hydrolase FlgJ [Marinobacterium rhizophilum]